MGDEGDSRMFVPDGFDINRLERFDIGLVPKLNENERGVISNMDIATLLLMQREPRPIKELAAAIGLWRRRENLTENSYLEDLRRYFVVRNGMASLSSKNLGWGYVALRKMELVGWLRPSSKE